MSEIRLIDANALIKEIAESIKIVDEWEAESHKIQDECGLKGAIDARRSLLSMISRVKDAPTIEAQLVKRGKWVIDESEGLYHPKIWHCHCSECGTDPMMYVGGSENWWLHRLPEFCPNCGSYNGD